VPVVQFRDHQCQDQQQLVQSDRENVHQCLVHVQVQYVQVLQHVHNKVHDQVVQVDLVVPVDQQVHHAQVEPAHQIILRIAHHQHQQLVHQHLVAKVAADINAVALQVPLVSKVENLVKRTRVRKRCVKSSTTWRHHHLVAQ
jgi:hypothetical protein